MARLGEGGRRQRQAWGGAEDTHTNHASRLQGIQRTAQRLTTGGASSAACRISQRRRSADEGRKQVRASAQHGWAQEDYGRCVGGVGVGVGRVAAKRQVDRQVDRQVEKEEDDAARAPIGCSQKEPWKAGRASVGGCWKAEKRRGNRSPSLRGRKGSMSASNQPPRPEQGLGSGLLWTNMARRVVAPGTGGCAWK